jgi:hypothetical protein
VIAWKLSELGTALLELGWGVVGWLVLREIRLMVCAYLQRGPPPD